MKPSKMIAFYRFTSYLLMLGVIHSGMTPVFYKSISLDALWFFGTGLSLVFLCLLNIAASKLLNKWLLKIALLANIIGTSFSFMILTVLNAPQAYVGLVFHLTVLIANIMVIVNLKLNYENS